MSQQIALPHAGIVLLVGPSNSGKTTLLNQLVEREVLLRSEIVSSDQFRVLVSDMDYIDLKKHSKDEQEVLYAKYQQISQSAFEAMSVLINTRCALGKLTVVDATHLWPEDRKNYIILASKNHVSAMAIVLDLPEKILLDRDAQRELPRGRNRIKQQVRNFKNNLHSLKTEGFSTVNILNERQLEQSTFIRLSNPLVKEAGAGLDFIGDIHGCYDEFLELLDKLGYNQNEEGLYVHPEGRKLVSVGDILGRGPKSIACIKFFQEHVEQDLAYMVDSNHGWKIARWLSGRKVELTHGDEKVAAEFEHYEHNQGKEATDRFKEQVKNFLLAAPSNLVFSKNGVEGIVATHAGIRDTYIGKQSNRISDFCRYGDTDGVYDDGKPIRKDWFVEHQSGEIIVWGHDPNPQPLVVNNTINIDQGVVSGGRLTAYRYPKKVFVWVEAHKDYAEDPESLLQKWKKERFSPPNIQSFLSGYSVNTEDYGEIRIKEEYVKSSIEEVSHYTVPIEELVYIPPTMSPAPEPSSLQDYLEHPKEAFDYYRDQNVTKMVVEKKHMGSRAILLLFKDEESAVNYVGSPTLGTIYTRTGRTFFDQAMTQMIVRQLNADLKSADYFAKHKTDFVLLDAEVLPWNLKAKELISAQYAHVSEVALMDRRKILEKLEQAQEKGWDVSSWIEEFKLKLGNAKVFREVFQKYCWDTQGIEGIKIAPFHVLAQSEQTFFDQSHIWHMEQNRELAKLSDLFIETEFKVVMDEASEQEAIRWWQEITEDGHEGFVVKPETYIARNNKGRIIQPAIKVRGRKYLHIIYGIDYLQPENLTRLKNRNVSRKQRHALMEFALGIEGVKRFVRTESVARIHECVLATLALEAEPVDPRL
ncbi:polynucleotide kinase-phosphatase [Desulfosporosinus nitroreducens]|uniref:Polynucleotide kinase-phosphatase n=1 Tax=Desulfosporosinus nitroreducens TaxID=2018668 RepID=A0ABT8QTQ5_9FIRM|nr:polynucleotide kinase-phosphatase [Desulfosporosinus nitroreducens]MDO0824222.1 polynucleotide kinase-phosphatase [Desulfosporosinus nitroreducens]